MNAASTPLMDADKISAKESILDKYPNVRRDEKNKDERSETIGRGVKQRWDVK